jgi:putative FmdB family regulatory protein
MPLYEYECGACGHRFEHIQKFSDPPVEKCPSCGALQVRKLMSSPAIQFKGSGWYITDYAKKDHSAAKKSDAAEATKSKTEGAEGKSEAKTDGKSETKTDSKSESKTESKTDKSTPST